MKRHRQVVPQHHYACLIHVSGHKYPKCRILMYMGSELLPYAPARDSSALAFALTRIRLSLLYSMKVVCDLVSLSLAARYEASRERCTRASVPQHP